MCSPSPSSLKYLVEQPLAGRQAQSAMSVSPLGTPYSKIMSNCSHGSVGTN